MSNKKKDKEPSGAASGRTPLEKFLFAPVNSVTKEKIFFNRLYADLKLAAARRGYHLSIFEPEVDRDKYDIVLDDGDNERRIQLKTVLKGAETPGWSTNKRFLRPDMIYGSRLGIVPADCGLGGGLILIEIDAAQDGAPVTYSYCDYFTVSALDMRMVLETEPETPAPKKPGRAPEKRRYFADNLLTELEKGGPGEPVSVPRQLLLRARSVDALLALMGLHNTTGCYLPSNAITEIIRDRFQADENGIPREDLKPEVTAMAYSWADDIRGLLDEPDLRSFVRNLEKG